MLYKGEISFYFDLPSRHSCRPRNPLLLALIRAIEIQLDLSNYCKLAHLLSFFGIEEQLAVVLNDEI